MGKSYKDFLKLAKDDIINQIVNDEDDCPEFYDNEGAIKFFTKKLKECKTIGDIIKHMQKEWGWGKIYFRFSIKVFEGKPGFADTEYYTSTSYNSYKKCYKELESFDYKEMWPYLRSVQRKSIQILHNDDILDIKYID